MWVGFCLVDRWFVVLDLLVSGFSGGFDSGVLGLVWCGLMFVVLAMFVLELV